MKKTLAALGLSSALLVSAYADSIINFGVGTMFSGTSTSSQPFPLGGLLNLLAVTNGTWDTLPTTLGYPSLNAVFTAQTGSFTPAGTVLVGQAVNNDSGGLGVGDGQFTLSYSGGFNAGDQLLLVAYPQLSLSSANPGVQNWGFFLRTDAILDGSDISWDAPADGGVYSLAAYTADLGGSLPNGQFTSGWDAGGGNGFGVPEPSTCALLALGGAACAGHLWRRQRR